MPQHTTCVLGKTNACVADGFGNTSTLGFGYQISAGFGLFSALTGSDCVRGWPGPGWAELEQNFWSVGSRGWGTRRARGARV